MCTMNSSKKKISQKKKQLKKASLTLVKVSVNNFIRICLSKMGFMKVRETICITLDHIGLIKRVNLIDGGGPLNQELTL